MTNYTVNLELYLMVDVDLQRFVNSDTILTIQEITFYHLQVATCVTILFRGVYWVTMKNVFSVFSAISAVSDGAWHACSQAIFAI